MSLSSTSIGSPAAVIPFRVRLEPGLIENICKLARSKRDTSSSGGDMSGLLCGRSEPGTRIVVALKPFVELPSDAAAGELANWERFYQAAAAEIQKDPKFSKLQIVGWYSFRDNGGLLHSDLEFHNEHFSSAEDVALIGWLDAPNQITAEVYSKSEDAKLSFDDYRWGSVRLSTEIQTMPEPLDLAMRIRLSDDSYLRTYEASEGLTPLGQLKEKLNAASDLVFGFFGRRNGREELERVRDIIGDARLPVRTEPADSKPAEAADQTVSKAPDASPTPVAKAAAVNVRPPVEIPAAASAASAPKVNETPPLPVPAAPTGDVSSFERYAHAEVDDDDFEYLHDRDTEPPEEVIHWPLVAGVFLLTAASVFGALVIRGSDSSTRAGRFFASLFQGGDLNLHVANEDARLRLTWNQRNSAVASATLGVLHIADGPIQRDVRLDGQHIADGSVLYRPLSNDVTFRLEVRGEQGNASGSVRILDALANGAGTALDVSATTPGTLVTAQYMNPVDPTAPHLLRPTGSSDTTTLEALPDNGLNTPVTTPPSTPTGAGRTQPSVATSVLPSASTQENPRYEKPSAPILPDKQPSSAADFGQSNGRETINGWDPAPVPKQARPSTNNLIAAMPIAQIAPNISNLPAGTIRSGMHVTVRAYISDSGHVTSARVLTRHVNSAVANLAVEAARQWLFEPARSNGRNVSSQREIVFDFPAH